LWYLHSGTLVPAQRGFAWCDWSINVNKGNTVGIVALDNLETGMVLAAEVHDRSGRLLLGAGTELNQKHLVIFRTWGVAEVNIAGADDSDGHAVLPSDVSQEELERAEKMLEPLFRLAGTENPVMKEIFNIAVLRKVTHGLE
jgi:hypothetical protein